MTAHQRAALAYLDSLGTVGAKMRRQSLEQRMRPTPKQEAPPPQDSTEEPLPELGEMFAASEP